MASVSLALDCKTSLGESPFADPSGRVYFVDINGKRVHWYDSVNGGTGHLATPQMVGSVVPRARGGLVASLEVPIMAVDLEANAVGEELAAMPEGHRGPDFRFNDGKCDPEGRLWTGSMNAHWRDPEAPPGRLYCLEAQPGGGSVLHEKVFPTRLANGMAWSSDRSTMYFIDSFYRTVDKFDWSAATGEITNRATVVQIPASEKGPPDGMAIDSRDKLWVVVAETGTVRQFDPETGAEIARVLLPIQRPTSCCFGGKDLSELYVVSREEKGNPPQSGGLFKCQIPGVKGPSFADSFAG